MSVEYGQKWTKMAQKCPPNAPKWLKMANRNNKITPYNAKHI
jgi:hypothetical protein